MLAIRTMCFVRCWLHDGNNLPIFGLHSNTITKVDQSRTHTREDEHKF